MQKQLYPLENADDSLESLVAERSRSSRAIYLTVVVLLLAGLATLPLVRVGVSVQSDGLIRPATEKHEVRARVSGFVEEVLVDRGDTITRGGTIFRLRAEPLEERIALAGSQLEQVRDFVADLERLTRAAGPGAASGAAFRTPRYRQEMTTLSDELRELDLQEDEAVTDLERGRALLERQLIPASEVEDLEFALSRIRADRALRWERAQATWQSELAARRTELRDLQAQEGRLAEEHSLYVVESPVGGTVEEMSPLSPGSFVQAGESLAVISPESEMVAEIYVTPRDIGVLREGNPVRMQVDAFNYNDWGFLTGRVTEVSDDFLLVQQQPVFRVKVALDQTHLQLENGFRGRLKKGMTLRARFMVAERSLWQLLRDDVNDWLNPVHAES